MNLPGICFAVGWVVTHQDLDEIRIKAFDVGTELVSIFERELFLTACFDGHGQQYPSVPS